MIYDTISQFSKTFKNTGFYIKNTRGKYKFFRKVNNTIYCGVVLPPNKQKRGITRSKQVKIDQNPIDKSPKLS